MKGGELQRQEGRQAAVARSVGTDVGTSAFLGRARRRKFFLHHTELFALQLCLLQCLREMWRRVLSAMAGGRAGVDVCASASAHLLKFRLGELELQLLCFDRLLKVLQRKGGGGSGMLWAAGPRSCP